MTSWLQGAVIYQIYPRSFADSNGDGVGDLRGVIDKLDHVASLGVDAFWLSPFFTSPMADYGYDVSDYCAVDPLFGAMEDFDALITRAHALGLKIIIDQVYSHSSIEHAWFKESRNGRENGKADWYVWADSKPDGSPPNNWQALFGGPSWTWDARRRQYYLHNFLAEQPDLNVRNPKVQDALLDVARFWLQRGVDGFRLDVANFFMHDESLRDNPALPFSETPARPHQFQRHFYDRTQDETLIFIARFRKLLDSYGAVSVGEIEDEEPLKVQRAYTDGPERLHTAYSFYLLRQNVLTPVIILDAMQGWQDAQGWPSWSLSNHDVIRFPTRLADDDPHRGKLMLALLLCLRGAAFLYQGDELGLPHADVPFERLKDPEAIAFWPHGIGRDGARTPMPWAKDGWIAGFTKAEDAWLPLDPRHRLLAVDTQKNDPDSMLAFTKAMIALRKAHPALQTGDFKILEMSPSLIAFERASDDERLACLFNLGDKPASFLSAEAPLWTHGDAQHADSRIVLGRYSAAIAPLA